MRVRTIIIIILLVALGFIGALYAKIEYQTSFDIKKMGDLVVPGAFEDPVYRKIFYKNTINAKLLYKLKNDDMVFIFFKRELEQHPDPEDLDPYGPWLFDRFEYVRQKEAGLKGNTWPPYF